MPSLLDRIFGTGWTRNLAADQPRWPKGDPRGGQWKSGGSVKSGSRMADNYTPPKYIENLKGQRVVPPRHFFRASNPGDERRIKTGATEWDSYLFVADSEKSASPYGSHITRVVAKPYAKILYEGTSEYRKLSKGTLSGNLLAHVSEVAKRAKIEGFDAVWYKRQSDVGTAILNRSAFEMT